MKYLIFTIVLMFFLSQIFFEGCTSKETAGLQSDKIQVLVSIPPQAYIVEQIAGDKVDVNVLIKPGQNPHNFELTPSFTKTVAASDLYFTIGLPLEGAIVNFIEENELNAHIYSLNGKDAESLEHAHEEPDMDHAHHIHEADPHIWLSPQKLELIAERCKDALVSFDSDNRDLYTNNYNAFVKNIQDTHERLTNMLKPYNGRTFYVFHPAFHHFAADFGLNQTAVESHGKSPTPKELKKLIDEANREGVKTVFAQPQFDQKSAQVIANAIGGEVVTIDPLKKNILENLDQISSKLIRSFQRNHE